MASDPNDPLIRYTLTQNPAPFPLEGQEVVDKVRQQTDIIMAQFMRVLPSNYVSRVNGPFYTLQFQAAAEQLALFIVTAQEVFKDSGYDYTRPEFLWQVLGTLVFPGATDQSGIPQLDGDVTYRDFLKKMVLLLLQGATPETMKDGVELLTEAEVLILERFLEARHPGSAFTIDDQFFFDIYVEGGTPPGTGFPADPFVLQNNVKLVIQALKPAHVLYGFSFLFRDAFGPLFSDSMSWDLSSYYYDDFRKFCYGAKEITGTSGITLSGRTLFSDPTLSFSSVQTGGRLVVTTGPNVGTYRIREVLAFPVSTDTFARPYVTSPTGLSGSATLSNGTLTDAAQDFAAAVEGEILTFASGPNAGSYRLETLLGSNGGPVGFSPGPATQVRVSPSMLRLETRMPSAVSGQSYQVDVDRLGVKVPRTILGEDASIQFYL
jgi:hypothetical protein